MNEKSGGHQEQYLSSELTNLTDRMQVSQLLSRFCSIVDDKCIHASAVAAIFTTDGRLVSPNGASVVGPEAIAAEKSKSFDRFRATHHVTSDHIIDFEGDTARLRANMTAMHLWYEEESDPRSLQAHFVAGGVFEGVAVRTADGWRFSELASRITWRTGAGLPTMAGLKSK
jgi:ketosteroid isomerase-like protein